MNRCCIIRRLGWTWHLCAILACLAMATSAGAEEVVRLADRPAVLEIENKRVIAVVESTEADAKAAQRLADLLRRIAPPQDETDRALPTVRLCVGAAHPLVQARADELALDSLHPAGYVMQQADAETLLITGRTSQGTAYAVDDFLKRFAGYRYFMPGPLGQIVPSLPAISLPANITIREEPDFITYSNAGLWGGNSTFFRSWRTSVLATHNLSHIYPPEKYAESHPEYYPLINGERAAPPQGPWNPCVSNPDLPAIAIEWARDYFERHPDSLGFSVGVNDGGGDCYCEPCMAWETTYGNRYVPFYNAVARLAAEAFPDKLVGFIAYGRALTPPQGITLEPNLYVEIASGLRDDLALMRAWHAAGARYIGHYGYLYGGRYVVPRHYPNILAEAWRKGHQTLGLRGAWVESYTINWFYDGPRQYVMNELAWNLDADVDALLHDYFANFYAEAAEPMRRYFDRIEAIHRRKADPLHFMGDSRTSAMFAEYTPEDLAYLDEQLNEAASLVRDEQAAERLRLFRVIEGFTRLLLQAHLDIRTLENLRPEEADSAARAVALVRSASERLHLAAAYEIASRDQRLILTNSTFEDFKSRILLRPELDKAADAAFEALSRHWAERNAQDEAKSFWQTQLAEVEDPQVRSLILTQLHRGDQLPDPEPLLPALDLQRQAVIPWREVGRQFRGWSTHGFPNARADFFVDTTDPSSETGALAIGFTSIRGTFGHSIRVVPGERYELSFRARYVRNTSSDSPEMGVYLPDTMPETEERGSGRFTVRWRNQGSWADQGAGRVAPITTPFTVDPQTGYAHVTTTFTVPENVDTAMFLFGVSRQGEQERMAFDRIMLRKIYEPNGQ